MIYYCTVDDCTLVCHNLEFKDRQKEPLKARNSHSLDGAASYSQEKSKPHTNEKIQTTTSNCNSGREIKLTKSLPHMYNMTRSPSVDEDGDAWRYVNEPYIYYTYLKYWLYLLQ